MAKKISGERQTAFYLGTGLMVIGGLLFLSTFFSFASDFGSPGVASDGGGVFARAIIGMVLAGVGQMIRHVGARGLAGSGVVLNPGQARKDLEPYSRMAGGMVKDALDEADVNLGSGRSSKPEQVIMIKCRDCGKLNEEDSKFCQECGERM